MNGHIKICFMLYFAIVLSHIDNNTCNLQQRTFLGPFFILSSIKSVFCVCVCVSSATKTYFREILNVMYTMCYVQYVQQRMFLIWENINRKFGERVAAKQAAIFDCLLYMRSRNSSAGLGVWTWT